MNLQDSLHKDHATSTATADQGRFSEQLMGEQEFRAALTGLIRSPVRIVFTSNRSTLISVRKSGKGEIRLRLQHAFRAADSATLQALAFFAEGRPCDPQIIDNFLIKKQHLVKFFSRPRKETGPIIRKAVFRDLEKILKMVTSDYGLCVEGIRIAWSKQGKTGGKRRSIRFGSFSASQRLIKIHPELDSPAIPDYFVEFVVYHELLHALFPPERASQGGRRQIHTPRFKAREKVFPLYEKAMRFEREFIKNRLG